MAGTVQTTGCIELGIVLQPVEAAAELEATAELEEEEVTELDIDTEDFKKDVTAPDVPAPQAKVGQLFLHSRGLQLCRFLCVCVIPFFRIAYCNQLLYGTGMQLSIAVSRL